MRAVFVGRTFKPNYGRLSGAECGFEILGGTGVDEPAPAAYCRLCVEQRCPRVCLRTRHRKQPPECAFVGNRRARLCENVERVLRNCEPVRLRARVLEKSDVDKAHAPDFLFVFEQALFGDCRCVGCVGAEARGVGFGSVANARGNVD